MKCSDFYLGQRVKIDPPTDQGEEWATVSKVGRNYVRVLTDGTYRDIRVRIGNLVAH